MISIRAAAVWLSRWNRCRGFGIQSPSDYRFARYVINEHWSFHAYAPLREKIKQNRKERRLSELLLRIANWQQPAVAVSTGCNSNTRAMYIKGGCRKCAVFKDTCSAGRINLLRITCENTDRESYNEALKKCSDHAVIIIEGIHGSHKARAFWKDIVKDTEHVIAFDLWYAGILLFNPKREKKTYIVNF